MSCNRKAQAASRVGLTGLSSDFAKKRELDDPFQLQGKGASASATCFAYAHGSQFLPVNLKKYRGNVLARATLF